MIHPFRNYFSDGSTTLMYTHNWLFRSLQYIADDMQHYSLEVNQLWLRDLRRKDVETIRWFHSGPSIISTMHSWHFILQMYAGKLMHINLMRHNLVIRCTVRLYSSATYPHWKEKLRICSYIISANIDQLAFIYIFFKKRNGLYTTNRFLTTPFVSNYLLF